MQYNCNKTVKKTKQNHESAVNSDLYRFDKAVHFLTICARNAIIKPS